MVLACVRLRFALIKGVRHFNKVGGEGRKRDALDERIHANGVGFYRRSLLTIRSSWPSGISLFSS